MKQGLKMGELLRIKAGRLFHSEIVPALEDGSMPVDADWDGYLRFGFEFSFLRDGEPWQGEGFCIGHVSEFEGERLLSIEYVDLVTEKKL
jgi:hypothetical protein